MAEAKKIGDMLKEAGLIDEFQLQSALSHQRNWGGKLGHILIELEFVREEELARVIAEKLKIPYVNLFEPEVPEAVLKLVKPEIAKKYHVVPAKKDKGMLVLAMVDPLDIEAIDTIRFATGLNIKPTLALESEIRDAIRKYYDGEEIVRKQPKVPFYQRTHSTGGKMELIRGSDLNMPKLEVGGAHSPILSKEDSVNQALQDSRMRLDALSTLLIEKGIITREELVSMIYQKKMGL
jgi:type II secretion system (T2SS) protein E